MTATLAPTAVETRGAETAESPVVWKTGLRAGLVAAAATTAVAAAASAAGVPLEVAGEAIPLAGFCQVTLMCVAVGVLVARVVARRARDAERTWVRTAMALTALSFVPDLTAAATTATKLVLMLTHVVAAAIVVPAVADRLADRS
jgi:uncharacterized membrane protein YhaH (DUF805 family)